MRMYGYGNLLATMSLTNPKLTRNIFSQILNRRADSSAAKIKNAFSEYDKKLAEAYDKKSSETYVKKTFDEKTSDMLKRYTAQMTQTPLYTGRSSYASNYSAIGGLIQYMI